MRWQLPLGTALVTGGTSGIGRATAVALARADLRVVLLTRHGDEAEKVAQEIGGNVCGIEGDVSDERSVAEAIDRTCSGLGGLRYVANCAGVHQSADFWKVTPADWNEMVNVNLVGAFNVARAARPYLQSASGASIVNVSSIEASRVVALVNQAAVPHYAAAKGGLEMLTKSLAHELARDNIRVNAVAPGPVATRLTASDHESAGHLPARFADHMLIRRYAAPSEIADVVCFLLSPASSFVTATTVCVDGGYSAL